MAADSMPQTMYIDVWTQHPVLPGDEHALQLQLQLAYVLHRTDIWQNHTRLRVVVVVEPDQDVGAAQAETRRLIELTRVEASVVVLRLGEGPEGYAPPPFGATAAADGVGSDDDDGLAASTDAGAGEGSYAAGRTTSPRPPVTSATMPVDRLDPESPPVLLTTPSAESKGGAEVKSGGGDGACDGGGASPARVGARLRATSLVSRILDRCHVLNRLMRRNVEHTCTLRRAVGAIDARPHPAPLPTPAPTHPRRCALHRCAIAPSRRHRRRARPGRAPLQPARVHREGDACARAGRRAAGAPHRAHARAGCCSPPGRALRPVRAAPGRAHGRSAAHGGGLCQPEGGCDRH